MRTLVSILLGIGLIAGVVYGGKRAWSGAVEWWQSPTATWHLDREATLEARLASVGELVEGAARNASSNDLELLFQRAAHQQMGNLMVAGIVESLNASWAILVLGSDGSFSYDEGFPLTGEVNIEGSWSWQREGSRALTLEQSGEALFGARLVGSRMELYPPKQPEVTILVLRKYTPITRAESWLTSKLRS